MDIITKYGVLSNCQEVTYHKGNVLATAFTHALTKLNTSIGKIRLAHEFSSERRKYIPSVKFFKDGTLQAVNLDRRVSVKTAVGNFNCEYVTFYQSGAPRRLLHLNGKLSGYWSEQQEAELAENTVLNLPCGLITAKVMTLHLYEDGMPSSITFFPGTVVPVMTGLGCLKTRIGISFYPNGALQSLEPAAPLEIQTPLGKIRAFDTEPIGIIGDNNSLLWDENGELCSCKTTDNLTITFANGTVTTLAADLKQSMCSDEVMVKSPYTLSWDKNKIYIDGIGTKKLIYNRLDLA